MAPPRGGLGRARGLAGAMGVALGAAAAALALTRRGRGEGRGGTGAASVRGPLPALLGEPPELPPDARPCTACSGAGKVACFSCRGAGAPPPPPPPPPSPLFLRPPPHPPSPGTRRGSLSGKPAVRRAREWPGGPRASLGGVAGVVRGLPGIGRGYMRALCGGRAVETAYWLPSPAPRG